MTASIHDIPSSGAKTLRLSITGDCNLDCFYCRPMGRRRDISQPASAIQPSDVSKLVKIVGEMGVERIIISGGEPLLRKDVPNFIKSAYAHKGIQEVRLVTNGTYLKTYADLLRKMGLRKVDITFDTINYSKFHSISKRDDLFRVLDGIEKVEKLKFPDIRLRVKLMRGINDDEIIDIARFSKDRKLHIQFIEYTPVGENGDDPYRERVFMSIVEAKRTIDNFQKLEAMHDLDGDKPKVCFKFNDAEGKISFISAQEIETERKIPRIVFTAEGVLYNENVPNRPQSILAELRRDAKEAKLHRTIQKVIHLEPPAPKSATKTAAKSKAKKRATKAASRASKTSSSRSRTTRSTRSRSTRATSARR